MASTSDIAKRYFAALTAHEQAWAGHADPVIGDARRRLERVAEAS